MNNLSREMYISNDKLFNLELNFSSGNFRLKIIIVNI